jgi:hypothetical protein
VVMPSPAGALAFAPLTAAPLPRGPWHLANP